MKYFNAGYCLEIHVSTTVLYHHFSRGVENSLPPPPWGKEIKDPREGEGKEKGKGRRGNGKEKGKKGRGKEEG